MIGLDTNVLVRFIVQDDPSQSLLASNFIEKECTAKTPGYINKIVLCEIVWVLKRAYGFEKNIIEDVLTKILSAKELLVENSAEARMALDEYSKGNADYSDYLIGICNSIEGCSSTITFDRKAANSNKFKLL